MKINHLPQGVRKDNIWTNINACSNKSDFPTTLCVHIIYILTNQISNFVWSNYKFSLYLRAEAPNKLTCIQVEICSLALGRAVKLNLWREEGSSESQKSVLFDSGEMR